MFCFDFNSLRTIIPKGLHTINLCRAITGAPSWGTLVSKQISGLHPSALAVYTWVINISFHQATQ